MIDHTVGYEVVTIPLQPYGQRLRLGRKPRTDADLPHVDDIIKRWLRRWERRTGLTASFPRASWETDPLTLQNYLLVKWDGAVLPAGVHAERFRRMLIAPNAERVLRIFRLKEAQH